VSDFFLAFVATGAENCTYRSCRGCCPQCTACHCSGPEPWQPPYRESTETYEVRNLYTREV